MRLRHLAALKSTSLAHVDVSWPAAVAVGGAFWAWLYQRSGSLAGPWLSHLVADAGIFFVGYQLIGDML